MKLLKDKAFLWALYGGDDKTAMTVEIHWIYVRTGVWFPSAPLSKNPTVIGFKTNSGWIYYFHDICSCFFCFAQSERYRLIRV